MSDRLSLCSPTLSRSLPRLRIRHRDEERGEVCLMTPRRILGHGSALRTRSASSLSCPVRSDLIRSHEEPPVLGVDSITHLTPVSPFPLRCVLTPAVVGTRSVPPSTYPVSCGPSPCSTGPVRPTEASPYPGPQGESGLSTMPKVTGGVSHLSGV